MQGKIMVNIIIHIFWTRVLKFPANHIMDSIDYIFLLAIIRSITINCFHIMITLTINFLCVCNYNNTQNFKQNATQYTG